MDFTRLKQLVVPEGGVKHIEIGGNTIWQKASRTYAGVEITTDNSSAITDFVTGNSASKTFTATFDVPPEEQDSREVWSFSNLPSGLSVSGATVSGTATTPCNKAVTITVTKGSYNSTKTYTFEVYGLAVSTASLPYAYQSFANHAIPCYSVTLEATKYLPSGTSGNPQYYASNLPSGLSLNSSTGVISGTVNDNSAQGWFTIPVYAKLGSYTSVVKNLSLYVGVPPDPSFTASEFLISLYASQCKASEYIDEVLQIANNNKYTIDITGNNFLYTTLNSPTYTLALCGSGSSSTPQIQMSVTIISNTVIRLSFSLLKRSTASASSLESRGYTSQNLGVTTYSNAEHTSYYASIFVPIRIKMVA